jgi:CRISPR-associated endonuclease/helicase Cas3
MTAIAKRTDHGTLPLTQHGLDVASCLEALLEEQVFEARVSAALGAPLDSVTRERLLLLAFLHDLGKASAAFQARIRGERDRGGHLSEVVALVMGHPDLARRALLDRIEGWGADLEPVLAALLAHHGRPITADPVPPDAWSRSPTYDPAAELTALGAAALRLFPAAFWDGPRFRFPAPLQHLFTGLLTIADQVGSMERHFPMGRTDLNRQATLLRARTAITAIGLSGTALREKLTGLSDERLFGWAEGAGLRAAQRLIRDLPPDIRLLLLEAETGSGKTEAALLRFRTLLEAGAVDALYFAVPTRTAAVQLHRRVDLATRRLMGAEAVLAVPGMISSGVASGTALPGFRVRWDDDPSGAVAEARWSAETGRRYLAAPVAVGTVDQALLSGLGARWAHMRGAGLSRSLLVVDEVHASDAYMTSLLKGAMDAHIRLGGHALLMSATLGSAARSRLLGTPLRDRDPDAPYPALSWAERGAARHLAVPDRGRPKRVGMRASPLIRCPGAIARVAVEAARAGARVLVIRNTVRAAAELFRAVQELDPAAPLLRVNGVPTLHHSRFAAEDRRRLDAAVEAALSPTGPSRGVIVIGTQTLEQSLDVDADLLITDLCPVDVLLQRMGRLFRHERPRPDGFTEPRCVVLTPDRIDPAAPLPTYGLGPAARDGSGVYPNLLTLEATVRLIRQSPVWEVPAMNRKLVEAGVDPDRLAARAAELGPAWAAHLDRAQGRDGAMRQQAGLVRLDRTRPFTFQDGLFPPEGARTRLGSESLELTLPAPVTGAFGEPVQHFALPYHMLRGAAPEAVNVTSTPDGIRITCDQIVYLYGPGGILSPALQGARYPVRTRATDPDAELA